MSVSPDTPVEQFKNIGPKSAGWLREIGIETYADLENAGYLLTYKMLKHRYKGISIVMLYALYGTLNDKHWNELSPEEKAMLKEAAKTPIDISFGD